MGFLFHFCAHHLIGRSIDIAISYQTPIPYFSDFFWGWRKGTYISPRDFSKPLSLVSYWDIQFVWYSKWRIWVLIYVRLQFDVQFIMQTFGCLPRCGENNCIPNKVDMSFAAWEQWKENLGIHKVSFFNIIITTGSKQSFYLKLQWEMKKLSPMIPPPWSCFCAVK